MSGNYYTSTDQTGVQRNSTNPGIFQSYNYLNVTSITTGSRYYHSIQIDIAHQWGEFFGTGGSFNVGFIASRGIFHNHPTLSQDLRPGVTQSPNVSSLRMLSSMYASSNVRYMFGRRALCYIYVCCCSLCYIKRYFYSRK